jgi:hypothetical protein
LPPNTSQSSDLQWHEPALRFSSAAFDGSSCCTLASAWQLAKRKKLNASQVVNSFDMRGVTVRTSAKLTLKRR